LEFLFDYGTSAKLTHNINGKCNYFPHVRPISHFEETEVATTLDDASKNPSQAFFLDQFGIWDEDQEPLETSHTEHEVPQQQQTKKKLSLTFFDKPRSQQCCLHLKNALDYLLDKLVDSITESEICIILEYASEDTQSNLLSLCVAAISKCGSIEPLKTELIKQKELIQIEFTMLMNSQLYTIPT
jgi:hypothetical protein